MKLGRNIAYYMFNVTAKLKTIKINTLPKRARKVNVFFMIDPVFGTMQTHILFYRAPLNVPLLPNP